MSDAQTPAAPERGTAPGAFRQGRRRDDDEIHISDYVRVLYRRRWLAVGTFVAVVAIVSVYTLTTTPVYEASVQILIENATPNVVSFQDVVDQNSTASDYYQTQYRILSSRSLARKSMDRAKLWDHPQFARGDGPNGWSLAGLVVSTARWIGGVFGNPYVPPSGETYRQARAIDDFLANLIISPIRTSRLVDIRFKSPDAELSARAANAVAEAYIQQNLEFRFAATKEAADWLATQLSEQRKLVETSELALQKYREDNDGLEDRQNADRSTIVVQRLGDLNAALTKARMERIDKESVYNQIAESRKDPAGGIAFPQILNSPLVSQLKTQVAGLQQQKAQLQERFGEQHPQMATVTSALATAEATLSAEIETIVRSLRNDYLAALGREKSLEEELEAQKADALAVSRRTIQYDALQREATSNRVMFDALQTRTKEMGVAGELRATNIHVVDPAEVPRRPASPRKLNNLMLAMVSGLLLGIALVFVAEYADTRLKDPRHIREYLRLPTLALLPALPASVARRDRFAWDSMPHSFVEAVKVLRTRLLFSVAEQPSRTLLVASAGAGEGKTLVATQLAATLAAAGRRVLLVDADMRRPRLHELFEVRQEPGFSQLLQGTAAVVDVMRPSRLPGLTILPAGSRASNAPELLGSPGFRACLASLGQDFEWIVIDAPPVTAVTDAAVIASHTSAVMFVVAAGMTNRRFAAAAVAQLEDAGGRLVGAVLNRVDTMPRPHYDAEQYGEKIAPYVSNEQVV